MEPHCFPATELPGCTKLFHAYLNTFDRVARFYSHAPKVENAAAYARTFAFSAETRAAVTEVLRAQNTALGSDASVAKNIAALAQGAFAVVTGQQTGLLTGPAYSIYKAVTAMAVAKKLTAQGVPCVPVFWMASEDHDFAEVAQTHWLHAAGMEDLQLAADPAMEGHSVGEIALGEPVRALANHAAELLSGPDAEAIAGMMREAVLPQETFASSFGKLLARIFRGHGLILLDPRAPELHRLAAPAFRHAITNRAKLTAGLLARGKELERSGFHVQVKVTESSTALFLNINGKRMPLRQRGDKLTAGTTSFAEAELLTQLEKHPERFSGNALFRPVIQDSLLPTVAYVAGPGEIAYYAQSEVLYRAVLGRMPVILPRAGFTLVEPHVARLLSKYKIDVKDVLTGPTKLRATLERQTLPIGLAKCFAAQEKELAAFLKKLTPALRKLDKTLTGASATAERKMLYQLRKLRDKTARANAFRSAVLARHQEMLNDALYPHAQPQERVLCLLPFLARHGLDLIARLEKLASPAGQHQTIFL